MGSSERDRVGGDFDRGGGDLGAPRATLDAGERALREARRRGFPKGLYSELDAALAAARPAMRAVHRARGDAAGAKAATEELDARLARVADEAEMVRYFLARREGRYSASYWDDLARGRFAEVFPEAAGQVRRVADEQRRRDARRREVRAAACQPRHRHGAHRRHRAPAGAPPCGERRGRCS